MSRSGIVNIDTVNTGAVLLASVAAMYFSAHAVEKFRKGKDKCLHIMVTR